VGDISGQTGFVDELVNEFSVVCQVPVQPLDGYGPLKTCSATQAAEVDGCHTSHSYLAVQGVAADKTRCL
jgi:hypothetical protein